MREFILDFPKQFKKGIKAAENADISKLITRKNGFQNLVICGMGGSAIPGDIIKTLPHFNLPIIIHRSYGLPREANEKSLIFISSYSGNTEETISSLNEAKKNNFNIIAFSKGGEIEKICLNEKIPYIKYSEEMPDFQPRFALGEVFSAMMLIFFRLGFLPHDPELKLGELTEILSGKNKSLEEQGKELAEKIFGKIVLIYAPYDLKCLSYIWKINFNENTKIPAFSNCFPELDHNEINSFVNLGKIAENKMLILNLYDKDLSERMNKRAKITSEISQGCGIKTTDVEILGLNILDKIFSSIILSMWTSYYLALLYKTDPEPVKIVEEFKIKLKDN